MTHISETNELPDDTLKQSDMRLQWELQQFGRLAEKLAKKYGVSVEITVRAE